MYIIYKESEDGSIGCVIDVIGVYENINKAKSDILKCKYILNKKYHILKNNDEEFKISFDEGYTEIYTKKIEINTIFQNVREWY